MKTVARAARHRRIRQAVKGTAARPRLVVFRGSKTLSAQLVDDAVGRVLLTIATPASTIEGGTKAGTELAAAAKKLNVTQAVFDRGGYRYHGAVKAVAEAARKNGLTI